ncbi:hypothetical protein [Aurantimonas sp. VKM B-3413]|uniref:hypothetical protein n=1 Tax=Aurantimonas sp. VKM B-3413 TaxID=2779401 RepID=UPI001E3ED3EB|nr:hypothetical protein [Aurantimonas sp. VKM B-3413]MCB8835962.1 hypothetical protein [Aurantimonas sp. VKM B-3413]
MSAIPSLREQLVTVADVYGKAIKRRRGTISAQIFNRGSRLDELAAGSSDVGTVKFEMAMQWLSDHWPEGAVWPEGVARPTPQPQDGAGVVGGAGADGSAHGGEPAAGGRSDHANSVSETLQTEGAAS